MAPTGRPAPVAVRRPPHRSWCRRPLLAKGAADDRMSIWQRQRPRPECDFDGRRPDRQRSSWDQKRLTWPWRSFQERYRLTVSFIWCHFGSGISRPCQRRPSILPAPMLTALLSAPTRANVAGPGPTTGLKMTLQVVAKRVLLGVWMFEVFGAQPGVAHSGRRPWPARSAPAVVGTRPVQAALRCIPAGSAR